MKRITTTIAATAVSMLVGAAAAHAAPPSNNPFAAPRAITEAATTGTVVDATAEVNEPAHAGQAAMRSVWYSWTPGEDQLVQIDTCFQELAFESRIATYRDGPGTGLSVADLTPVADSSVLSGYCGNGFGYGGAIEQFEVSAGTPYYTAVDAISGAGGFDLYLTEHVPSPSITSGPTGETSDNTPTFTFVSTEPGADYYCGIATHQVAETDGIAVEECGTSGSYTSPALANGAYKFGVLAVDPLTGAYDVRGAIREFTVNVGDPPGGGEPPTDTTAPQTTIDGAPKAKTRKRKATFEFSSSESGSVFECALNDGPFAACSSPHEVEARKGRNTFQVRAIDAAGNADATLATHSWKYKKRKKSSRRADGMGSHAIAPPTVLPLG